MVKITELAIGQRFRTGLTRRVGVLTEVRGFTEDATETQYWVRFLDGQEPSVKDVHHGLMVEPL